MSKQTVVNSRICMMREAGAVTRWHTIPHFGTDDVAGHSWRGLALLLCLHPNPSKKLLIYMHGHDLTERWTGDIPANAKRMFPTIAKGVREAELRLEHHYHLPGTDDINHEESNWARSIDALEAVLWLYDQIALGNANCAKAAHEIRDWLLSDRNKDWVPQPVRECAYSYVWERQDGYVVPDTTYGDNEDERHPGCKNDDCNNCGECLK